MRQQRSGMLISSAPIPNQVHQSLESIGALTRASHAPALWQVRLHPAVLGLAVTLNPE